MSLPTIQVPTFTVTLPLSKKEVKLRPFLVKEQKVLLQAIELGNESDISDTVVDILTVCTFNKVDIGKLPLADVEWLILQLRSKSVKEVLEMMFTCTNKLDDETVCGNKIPISLDLLSVQVETPEDHQYKVNITDKVGLVLKDISYDVYNKSLMNGFTTDDDKNILYDVIEAVFTEDEMWGHDDFTEKELTAFLDGLYTKDFEKIEKFIETMPTLKKSLDIKCSKCGFVEHYDMVGLASFLE
jgi:hypothetical protein